jgi:hypothetical protein
LQKTDEGLSGEAKLLAFLRDATPLDRKLWLAKLSTQERQTVHQLLRRVEDNPWTQYLTNPVGFVEQGLKETLWSKQREILLSVRDNKRTAVPACHAPGKSHLAARIVAWWVMCQPIGTAQVVTTATSFRQVRNILWSHIRKLHATHNLSGDCLTVEWKQNNSVVAFGFAPAQYNETALQGIHAPNLLVVVDEAGGISQTIGNALEALMTGGNTRLLLLGNPPTDQENSWFEQACTSDLYNTIKIGAHDTPNFTQEHTGNCTTCPKTVPTHPVSTHLVDESWVNDVIKELGNESPFAQARVYANFVRNTTNRVIPSHWIEEATKNLNPAPDNRIRLGIDIASDGGDEFAIARADGYTVTIVHTSSGEANANAVTVAQTCLRHIQQAEHDLQNQNQNQNEHPFAPQNPYNISETDPTKPIYHKAFRGGGGAFTKLSEGGYADTVSVKIDAIGVGWGVVSLLEQWGREGLHGARIVGVNVAERAVDVGRFRNVRAELWWNGRVLLEPDVDGFQLVRLDCDRRSVSQLGLAEFVSDSSGRVKVVSKSELRGRGLGSPDRAEAVLLALYEPFFVGVPLVAPVGLSQVNPWRF